MSRSSALCLALCVTACGGRQGAASDSTAPAAAGPDAPRTVAGAPSGAAPTPIASGAPPSGDATPAAEVPKASPVPDTCHPSGELCLLPPDFMGQLCTGKYTDLAIYLFQKKQPWTRAYIQSREIDAINTLGGPVSDSKLVFGEEVLVVGRQGGGGGGKVQISGNSGYQVLRWDGTCATLADHEIVFYVPVLPRNAPIVWKYLDESLQDVLLQNPRVEEASKAHRTECHGLRFGSHSKKCERAQHKLEDAITVAVRQGLEVPLPPRLPE